MIFATWISILFTVAAATVTRPEKKALLPTVILKLFTARNYEIESDRVRVVVQQYPVSQFIMSKRSICEDVATVKAIVKEASYMSRYHERFVSIVASHFGTALLVELQDLDKSVNHHLERFRQRNPRLHDLLKDDLAIPHKAIIRLTFLKRIILDQEVHNGSFEAVIKAALETGKLFKKSSLDFNEIMNETMENMKKSLWSSLSLSQVLSPVWFLSAALRNPQQNQNLTGVNDSVLAGLLAEGVDPRVLSCVCRSFAKQSIVSRAVKAAKDHQLLPIIKQMYPALTHFYLNTRANPKYRGRAVSALLSAILFKHNCNPAYRRVDYAMRCRLLNALLSAHDDLSVTERTTLVFLPWIYYLPIPMAASDWLPIVDWVIAGRRDDASLLRLMRSRVATGLWPVSEDEIASRMVMLAYWQHYGDVIPCRCPPNDIYDDQAWTNWAKAHARL